MSFFDTTTPDRKTFDKVKFLTLTPGVHTTRIIGNARRIFVHYLASQRVTLACLGDDECPICKDNKKIMFEHPSDFNTQPGFIARQTRFVMNVLDRTNGKICPNCGSENKRTANNQYSPICWNCEAVITNEPIRPLDTVKVLGISKTNADLLNTFENNTLDDAGNKLGLNNFDIVWTVVKGANSKNVVSPSVGTGRDAVTVSEESLFDLDRASIHLDANEIHEVLKGVSLKDIFLARKNSKTASDTDTNIKSVDDSVAELFSA